MLYARRDFRPDKLPRRMKNWFVRQYAGGKPERVTISPRGASTLRQDYKNEHNNRQRTYNRKAITRALRGIDDEGEESDRQGSSEPPPENAGGPR